MPKRPRAHHLEAMSRARLHERFVAVGWSVEDLREDYGEDLLVRIFERGDATPFNFFVQAKATDNIARYVAKDGRSLFFPISRSHLRHWSRFWEPVVLTIWDASSDVTYWALVQDAETLTPRRAQRMPEQATVRVCVWLDDVLDDVGIERILVRTKRRFARFNSEQEGANILIELLQEQLGYKIDYDAHLGVLLITRPDGTHELIAFGQMAAKLEAMALRGGVSYEEVFERAVRTTADIARAFDEGVVQLQDAKGHTIEEWKTFEDLTRYVDRSDETNDR